MPPPVKEKMKRFRFVASHKDTIKAFMDANAKPYDWIRSVVMPAMKYKKSYIPKDIWKSLRKTYNELNQQS